MRIGVIGATGVVGSEIVRLLARIPHTSLHLFSRKTPLTLSALRSLDLAFFAAGGAISREWIPQRGSTLVIDSSSVFRMQPDVPLVIPEINADALRHHNGLIASPNCTATILLMPLAPLHRAYRVKRIVAATYQAASGGGRSLLDLLEGRPSTTSLPFPYPFNLYPHNSPLLPSGYVDEELKMLHETRKILSDDTIQLTATCVRVPVRRAHSVSANCEFHSDPTSIYPLWETTPGLRIFEDRAQNRFATPLDATDQEDVLVGRLRRDPTQPNTLEFWSVGDQLLKGAALNAVQIAEALVLTKI